MNAREIRDKLQWLRAEDGVVPPAEAESAIGDILLPLLKAEGLELLVHKDPTFSGIDFAATRTDDPERRLSLAIEYKHYRNGSSVGAEIVERLLGTISSGPFDRALLVSRSGFSRRALEIAARAQISVELLDLAAISSWIDRVEEKPSANAKRVAFMVKSISHEFARLVAQDPSVLDHIEWRDLERMMSRVMEGIGFKTTLTPASKDGGKDLILKCTINAKEESYIVELKHWRAGKPVIKGAVSDFFNVIVREGREGGLFLSTSGYASNISEALTELSRQKLRLGDKSKVVMLAQTYLRANSGLWSPPEQLPEILFDGMFQFPAAKPGT